MEAPQRLAPSLGRVPVGVWIACCALPIAGFLFFGSTGQDDSYITYGAARALELTGGIVNVNGDRVEQSSSLLTTLLLAAFAWITRVEVPTAGVIVSVAAGALTALAASRLARRVDPAIELPAAIITALVPQLVYWSYSGMETALASAVLAASLALTVGWIDRSEGAPRTWLVALAYAGAVSVRPEMVFVLGTALVIIGASTAALARIARQPVDRGRVGRTMLLLAVVVALALALALGRRLYFGAWVPQPVLAKMTEANTFGRLATGARYLGKHVRSPAIVALALLTVGFAVAVVRRARRGEPTPTIAIALLAGSAAEVAFTLSSGGDWMKPMRFIVPALPLMAVCGCAVLHELLRGRWRATAFAVVGVIELVGLFRVVQRESSGVPVWARGATRHWYDTPNRVRERDRRFTPLLEAVIKEAYRIKGGAPVQVASAQGGMVMYAVSGSLPGDVRFVDQCGLVTRDVTECSSLPKVKHDAFGVRLGLRRLLTGRARACGIDPDIVFNVFHQGDDHRQEIVAAKGYRLVVDKMFDRALRRSFWSGSRDMALGQWVAIREDIAAQMAPGVLPDGVIAER